MMKMKTTVLALLVAVTPQARATINRAFRADDFEILWTANPSEAAAASARHRPDLLLLDLNQRLYKGWGILEQLRTANPNAPVVVLSEHESIYDQAVVNRNGAVLQKPVGAATLAKTVNALLNEPATDTALPGNQDAAPGSAIAKSERFRAEMLERYHAPFEVPALYRYWGINE